MAFRWTARQFVAGALCLDLVNTVIYLNDPSRREDRLQSVADLKRWVVGANRFALDARARQPIALGGNSTSAAFLARTRRVRNTVARLFMALANRAAPPADDLRRLLRVYETELAGVRVVGAEQGLDLAAPGAKARRLPLLPVVTHSAIALAFSARTRRIKACPSCGWLFIDRSKAGRRVWCDMATCGNRAKARRRYTRARAGQASGRPEASHTKER